MNDHFPAVRDLPRHALVAPGMTQPDVAQLLPATAVEAAERAFDASYYDDADELNAALLAATPIVRIAEIDDLEAEIKRRMGITQEDKHSGLHEVLGILVGRRRQLEAMR